MLANAFKSGQVFAGSFILGDINEKFFGPLKNADLG
jgi:hypothetical protein